jgi:hypothetical protein
MSSTTIQFGTTGAGYVTLPSLITYLESRGIGAVEATHLQNIVNYFLSLFAVYPSGTATKAVGTVYADSTLITGWARFSKYIFDVAIGTFIGYGGNGSTAVFPSAPADSDVETWCSVNRPDISTTIAAVLADIISIDLNPYLVINLANTPALPTGDPQVPDNPVLIYSSLVSSTLETITRYLRTVAGAADTSAIASLAMGPTKDASANSSSYGGTEVPALPEVVI